MDHLHMRRFISSRQSVGFIFVTNRFTSGIKLAGFTVAP